MNCRTNFVTIGFAIALLFISCKDATKTEVRYSGALGSMMTGNLTATASLDTLRHKQSLYALGAMENLKGEIQIFDSQPFNSSVYSDEIVLDKTFGTKAALLVYAEVPKWQYIAIHEEVDSSERLEEFIELKANEKGMNMEEPFPFLIVGIANSLKWHVIDWEEGDIVHSHQKHKQAGVNGVLENEEVEIIGFYSRSHQAIFTHHSTFMHMHFKNKDEQIAGHLDELLLGSNMTLKLPKF